MELGHQLALAHQQVFKVRQPGAPLRLGSEAGLFGPDLLASPGVMMAPAMGAFRGDGEGPSLGGQPLTTAVTLTGAQPVREHFARAQFVEVSEDERLTKPAYESLDAGVEFTSAGFDVSQPASFHDAACTAGSAPELTMK